MTRRRLLRAGPMALVAVIAACQLSGEEYAKIDAWLLCDDCTNGERDSVRRIGPKATHTLARALVGPSAGRVANVRAQIRQTYSTTPVGAMTEAEYVDHYLANYVALYQQRAAISLGDIGGNRAFSALMTARDSAGARQYRADVLRVIESVLAGRNRPPFGGTVQPPAARFLDTVRVAQGTGAAWDGDETLRLNGAPFPDGLVVARWPDSLKFVAVGEPGTYTLSVGGLGPNDAETAAIPFRVTSLRYETQPPASARFVPAAALPETVYLALAAVSGDTSEYFRFQPSAELPLTVAVQSVGLQSPSMRWYGCPGPVPGTLSSTLRGLVVDEAGAPAGNAVARIMQSAQGTITDGTGRFIIGGIPLTASALLQVRVQRLASSPHDYHVQGSVDSVQLGLLAANATEATARPRLVASVRIPSGECRLLRLGVSPDRLRIIRMILTSP